MMRKHDHASESQGPHQFNRRVRMLFGSVGPTTMGDKSILNFFKTLKEEMLQAKGFSDALTGERFAHIVSHLTKILLSLTHVFTNASTKFTKDEYE